MFALVSNKLGICRQYSRANSAVFKGDVLRGGSINSIAKSLKTSTEMITFWVGKYHYHGLEALKKSYTSFSLEDKLNIINYMNENGLSPLETAVQFNLSSPGMIRKWRSSFRNDGIDAENGGV